MSRCISLTTHKPSVTVSLRQVFAGVPEAGETLAVDSPLAKIRCMRRIANERYADEMGLNEVHSE